MSFLHCFRLALYVYEYLLHVGAQKAAQTFLNEVNITLIIICSGSYSQLLSRKYLPFDKYPRLKQKLMDIFLGGKEKSHIARRDTLFVDGKWEFYVLVKDKIGQSNITISSSFNYMQKIWVFYSDWTIIDPVWELSLSLFCLLDDVSFRHFFLDSLGEEHNTGGASWISALLVVVSVTVSQCHSVTVSHISLLQCVLGPVLCRA